MVSGVQVCNYYPGDAIPHVQADAQQAFEESDGMSHARRRPRLRRPQPRVTLPRHGGTSAPCSVRLRTWSRASPGRVQSPRRSSAVASQ